MQPFNQSRNISTIVDAIQVLDNSVSSRAYIIRNLSIRILFVIYIGTLFFDLGAVFQAALAVTGTIYIIAQLFFIVKFSREAGYRLREWKLLYNQLGRFYTLFVWLMALTAVAISAEVLYVPTLDTIPEQFQFYQNIAFVALLLSFITTSLTDTVLTPVMQFRFKNSYLKSPEQQVLVEESEATRDIKYVQIAMNILYEKPQIQMTKEEDTKTEEDSPFSVQSQSEWNETQDSYEEVDAIDIETDEDAQVRKNAEEKLKEMRGTKRFSRSREDLALTADELDKLSAEEVEALLRG